MTITLQFSTAEDSLGNWASALIRRINHSPFSHVDLILPGGNMLGASDQGSSSPVIAGNPCGVAIRPPEYQAFGTRRRMVLDVPDQRIIGAAATQLGKPFDSSGLHDFLSDAFPGLRDWRDPDKWFCAELIAWALEQGGMWSHSLPWPKNRVSPTDLLLVLLMDDRWVNRDVFWDPVPGLVLGPKEK